MKDLRKIGYIFSGQFKASLANKRVWAGYIVGILVALKSAYFYLGYADLRVIQIFESYIVGCMNVGDVTLLLIGFVIIISDAPFLDHRSTLALYRTGRTQWFLGMTVYMFVHALLYYGTALLTTVIFSMRQGYIHNLWSRPLTNHVRFPSGQSVADWGLPIIGEKLIEDYMPYSALTWTILLMLLYSLIIAILLFIFNAASNKAFGTAIAAAVHVVGYVIMYDGLVPFFNKLSLFNNSIFNQHLLSDMSAVTSFFYLLTVLILLIFTGPVIIRHSDFKSGIGVGFE